MAERTGVAEVGSGASHDVEVRDFLAQQCDFLIRAIRSHKRCLCIHLNM
jgi:hypothetical protein